MKTYFKILVGLTAILSLILVWFLVEEHQEEQSEEEAEQEHVIKIEEEQFKEKKILLHQVQEEELNSRITVPGKIVLNADQVIHYIPKVSGIVRTTLKNIGENVVVNDVLALIESKEFAEAQAAYRGIWEKFLLAQENLNRENELFNLRITSIHDLQQAKTELAQTSLDLSLAKNKLLLMGISESQLEEIVHGTTDINLSLIELRSPLTGTIIEKNIFPGEYVDSTKEIYQIANLKNVWGEITLYPRDLLHVKKGNNVTIENLQQVKQVASVTFISPIVNEDNHSVKAIVLIDNTNEIWQPGSYIYAHLNTHSPTKKTAIPKDSIQMIEDKPCVFIQCEEGFRVQSVTTGFEDENYVEVVSGLGLGDIIASGNTFLLKADLLKEQAVDDD